MHTHHTNRGDGHASCTPGDTPVSCTHRGRAACTHMGCTLPATTGSVHTLCTLMRHLHAGGMPHAHMAAPGGRGARCAHTRAWRVKVGGGPDARGPCSAAPPTRVPLSVPQEDNVRASLPLDHTPEEYGRRDTECVPTRTYLGGRGREQDGAGSLDTWGLSAFGGGS